MKEKNFERNVKIAIAGLAIIVVVLGLCSFLQFTKPYAVAEDGEKVETPWAVNIGENETFVVATEKEGQDIIEQVKNSYSTKDTKSESTTLTPEITVTQKELERGEEVPVLTDTQEAVAEVIAANETGDPAVTVTTVEQVTTTKAIDYKTEYEESDELYVGEEKVLKKGKKGKRTIVKQVIKENGETISKEVVSSSIEEKPIKRVIEKGTKTRDVVAPVTTASSGNRGTSTSAGSSGGSNSSGSTGSSGNSSSGSDSSGEQTTRSGSGQDVADYALQFVGNPYVYGGSSLTNGTDCSGFTMSVYKKFGISLPHSSSAQRSYGKGVSYSDAKPGDIICYSGHVGIYIGNGKIVHASTPSSGIKVSTATYKKILTVRRFFE